MAREDRRYGHESIDKKNDSQKREIKKDKEIQGPLDKNIEDYKIESTRHGEGKGDYKERYEKRDIDSEQLQRRKQYAQKEEEKEKHSKKY